MNNGLYISENTLDKVHRVIERRSNNFEEAVSLVLQEGEPTDAIISWREVVKRAAVMDDCTFKRVYILLVSAQSAVTLESFCFYNLIR